MKIAILTAYNERYVPIADVTLPFLKAYVDRHGYGLHIGRYEENPTNLIGYGDRGKIGLYLAHYREHDALCWLDIDVLVANQSIRIEDVLGDRPFLWTYDVNGPCSGFWIARCTPPVAMTLRKVREEAQLNGRVIARELSNPHRVTVQFEPYGTSDQMQMRALMSIPPYSQVLQHCVSCKEAGHCFDNDVLNLPVEYRYISDYDPGDWLYTLPSVELERRRDLLEQKAKELRHAGFRLSRPDDHGGNGNDRAESPAGEPAAADA